MTNIRHKGRPPTNQSRRPFGTWSSAITPESLVTGSVGISEVVPEADGVWWAESRPSEGGRTALLHYHNGSVLEVTDHDANVRTTVHEYGGGSWWVDSGVCYYVEYRDQRLRSKQPGKSSILLSPPPDMACGLRYADFRLTVDKQWLICVGEKHIKNHEPENYLIAVSTDGSMRTIKLAFGADFYGSPRISPDGSHLAWIQWNHPNMPWDDTTLMAAELISEPGGLILSNCRVVAGGPNEAIVQPEWSPDGRLHYLSDSNDLWQLYVDGESKPVLKIDGEIGYPPWVFGLSRYAFKSDGSAIVARFDNGVDNLAGYESYTSFHSVRTHGNKVAFSAASWEAESTVFYDDKIVHSPRQESTENGYAFAAEQLVFPTANGEKAFALYYPPANPDFLGLDNEKPPLIVLAHGGPTSAARSQYSLARQFWTSRGFAVVDVNYRGSSGFGRAYRKKLNEMWGVYDVEDCIHVARYLVNRGDVDPARLIIRGGSAGGFTVLSALAFFDDFTAGTNMFGVADLEALATDTHKFESRYLDNLVGPYPAKKELYRLRSPINHLAGFNTPMLVLQGSDDTIVPPNQSRMIVDALNERKVPVAYIEYEGEQHGFRKSETIKSALSSELAFYGKVFNFDPAGPEFDLTIKNL